MDLVNSYRNLELSISKYMLRRIIPSTFIGLLISIILGLTFSEVFLESFFVITLYVLPIFTTVVAVLYPVIHDEIRSMKIDKDMHLFITRLGALSASEISDRGFKELFGEMKMYGELGEEMKRLEKLANEWNMSLPEASRTIAKNTPSELLSDFLERMAYALETHTSPKEFFEDEQDTVMDAYSNEFENMLFRLDVIRELYVASITMVLFAMVLAVIVPLLIEINSDVIITLVFFLFVIVSFISGWIFLKIIPETRIWYEGELRSEIDDKLDKIFMISLAVSGGIAIPLIFLPLPFLSLLLKLAIILTPLIIPGIYAGLEESRILRRDSNFPSFIRSLAGNTPAQTADHTKSVGKLRYHDLGTLTDNIKSLYRRLKMNIDSDSSWDYFGSETGSFLINEFSDIFLTSSQHGAHPEETAPIISENFIEVRGLRGKKILRAKSLQSVFYGVIAVLTLTMVTVFLIVSEINDMIAEIEMPTGFRGMFGDLGFIQTTPISLGSYYDLIIIMVLTQAVTSTVIGWHIKGEHRYVSIAKFTVMIWIAAAAFKAAELGVSIIFG
ncbi:MAG: type II secretion system F family protein [Candidatus Thermoplasmatota archaeon]|nr:type II secretion system F family protein [Candidatus Thermoplasmatota archaeon]